MMPSGEHHQTCPVYCPTPTWIFLMGLAGASPSFSDSFSSFTCDSSLKTDSTKTSWRSRNRFGPNISCNFAWSLNCDETCQPVPISPPPLGSPMQELSVKVLSHPGPGHSRWIVATGLFLEDISPLTQEPSPVLQDLMRFIRQNNGGDAPLHLSRQSFVVSLFFTGTLDYFQNWAINILKIVLIQRSGLLHRAPAHLSRSVLSCPSVMACRPELMGTGGTGLCTTCFLASKDECTLVIRTRWERHNAVPNTSRFTVQ